MLTLRPLCGVFLLTIVSSAPSKASLKIAVVGEGVIGLNTATAIFELAQERGISPPSIEIFHNKDFKDILSKNIAGLFRVDDGSDINKKYGRDTFTRLAKYWRQHGGRSGVQLVSGHIISDNPEKLQAQRKNYGDIVYNYRDLDDRELHGPASLFDFPLNSSSQGIHYTAFTSEGLLFCPFLKKELIARGVKFTKRNLKNLNELGTKFDVVVNAAGLYGGVLAGDDAGNVFPIRGVLLRVDAPWQKHFLYRDFGTFTIPVIEGVAVGTVKQVNEIYPLEVTSKDKIDIAKRYIELQPSFKDVQLKSSYIGYRPGRKSLRVEKQERSVGSKKFKVVHNYGHGGNGFTLAYGSALHAAHLVLGLDTAEYDRIAPPTVPPNSTLPSWVSVLFP
ncbi:unnamed protein product [Caenorhabditis auriculariae]|uniref:FAD dependent oxidoreductase domain-containing protein n=1 Tax=Caenorhabditis auriculariae TaxID=2777116 RepID=A0A8S1H6P0_9PELO|nr:unnamed protein product [Caenorhabditis auriculariae]